MEEVEEEEEQEKLAVRNTLVMAVELVAVVAAAVNAAITDNYLACYTS
jgi:hypothetical protein